MSFKELYNKRQDMPRYVKRTGFKDAILEITKMEGVAFVVHDMNPKVCRGMFFSARAADVRIVQQVGFKNVIVVTRHLSDCWKRFISIKELMHFFTPPDRAVDTGEAFDTLLQELSNPDGTPSPQTADEYDAAWMAIAIICREEHRQELKNMRINNEISDYEIALKLKIPEFYVPFLFSDSYERRLRKLMA